LALVLSTLALHFAAIGVRVRELGQVCLEPEAACHARPARLTPADAAELQAAGLSPMGFAALQAGKWLVFSGLWMLVGAVIFVRRSDEVIGLLAAYFLMTFPSQWDYLHVVLARAYPVAALPLQWLGFTSTLSIVLFLALFPNGRFVPLWTGWLALAWMLIPTRLPPGLGLSAVWGNVLQVVNVAAMGVLVVAQVIRYRRYSGPVERQRTRWVVFGLCVSLVFLALMIGLAMGGAWLGAQPGPWDDLASEWIYQVVVGLIPLTIGVAILRQRLWDIDVIIRRTLIYSVLTGVLALAYLGSVLVLQGVFRALTGQGQNSLVVVLSTLAIAALFGPVRGRVQRAIDRRFYRRKYDAARTLSEFGAALRDETDLEQLSAELAGVVDQAMQPETVWLWLKPAARPDQRTRLI
jgi:hypothetical protein